MHEILTVQKSAVFSPCLLTRVSREDLARKVSSDLSLSMKFGLKQELSYRERIARQLRTQYVEGIHSNPVTLKSRSRVTKVIGNGTIG